MKEHLKRSGKKTARVTLWRFYHTHMNTLIRWEDK